ncbi:MAG: transcriptional repressor [Phycisphaerales bacterium]|jgi:Fur family ferric uptake transcriptional regulator|nr:transcriptional repressor [Phycisphaerales bacterium]
MDAPPIDDTPDLPPILAPLCAVFRRHLKSCSLRYTPERADVLAAVMDSEDLFDADALLDRMRADGANVSKATVYRTLRLLQDAGILTPFMLLDAKVTHYQLAYGRTPKDYLVCVRTGRFEAINSDEVVALRDRLADERGWEVSGHRFVIYGASPEV